MPLCGNRSRAVLHIVCCHGYGADDLHFEPDGQDRARRCRCCRRGIGELHDSHWFASRSRIENTGPKAGLRPITTTSSFQGVEVPAPPAMALQKVLLADAQAQVTTESLGSQTMEGVFVTGVRTTRTIPAGQIGNERDDR